jgi:hypothetical protein
MSQRIMPPVLLGAAARAAHSPPEKLEHASSSMRRMSGAIGSVMLVFRLSEFGIQLSFAPTDYSFPI